LITRLESYTKDATQAGPSPHAETPAQDAHAGEVRARLVKDVTLGIGVSAYLALVLFDNIESPLLSIGLIVVVAYELVQPHLRNR
jgi:hypothetical protein